MIRVHFGENLPYLKSLPDRSVDFVYIDPPFNTGIEQISHVGEYPDNDSEYLGSLGLRLIELRRVLKPLGGIIVHVDHHEAHRVRVLLDDIFGRQCFKNEIIWAYDYGGRSTSRWPCKHDNLYWYSRDANAWYYDQAASDRLPYMSPEYVGMVKTARGKIPTDVWWQTIVPTKSAERLGYPTQKPMALLTRIVKVHIPKGGTILDCYAGSGTTGDAAESLGYNSILVDRNPDAISTMQRRFSKYANTTFTFR